MLRNERIPECRECGALLSHLETFAGVCLIHMTREQTLAVADRSVREAAAPIPTGAAHDE